METWKTAFLKQARSDMAVFDVMGRYPLCQQLHYLQMATEKLAKAYWSSMNGTRRPPATHKKFVVFLQACCEIPRIRRAYGMSQPQFRAMVRSLLPTAHEVENLAPTGDMDKPNPEYPWEENGKVITPVDYPFSTLRLSVPTMGKLVDLVRVCMKVADYTA